jgi:hypothetical protein
MRCARPTNAGNAYSEAGHGNSSAFRAIHRGFLSGACISTIVPVLDALMSVLRREQRLQTK